MTTMLLYLTVGLVAVLATRKLARRGFGAAPAFTLWCLPALLAVLPWLPSLPTSLAIMPTLPVLPAATTLLPPQVAASASHWPLILWLTGAALALLRLIVHYLRLQRQCRRPPVALLRQLEGALDGLPPERVRLHPAGPAVLWAPRSRLLLPADFLERFDATERRLVLQHERMHLRRGDALWSLLAELACAALWFHPLAWLALPRFRLDQELACDERVLRQCPRDEARYAHTLLQTTGTLATPALIPWLAEPQLKERLSMIQRQRPGPLRRRIGFTTITALVLGAALAAQAGTPPPQADASYANQPAPTYPADSIANHDEGTVILDVVVGRDGKPQTVDVDPATHASAPLIAAANKAVMQWRFKPAMKDGKPVQSRVRVPVTFSLSERL